MTFEFLFQPDTALYVSFLTFIMTSLVRKKNGGELLSPDRFVRDGIAGVVIYVMALLWFCFMVDFSALDHWRQQPLGKLTIHMAMFGIILTRFQSLKKSALNRA